ncbi:carbonic anhydrase [Thiohalorhabdus sp. Cl-TMA]|uniref:Carbonic anhydrase n=1 Tax=Thiohalorhabdus methylotrophus TaxID=3242694 RepID=A0ABV4TV33_9GAMM
MTGVMDGRGLAGTLIFHDIPAKWAYPMGDIRNLLEHNHRWAEGVQAEHPDFFSELARQQSPAYFWIGCADSRVPANQIVDRKPGEIFVHRNVANLAPHNDFNYLSVLQYAVEVLKVRHVIVTGHYGCGGIRAALEGKGSGFITGWLEMIRDVADQHREELDPLDFEARVDRLCEINVQHQVANVCRTQVVREAWERGQPLEVHGWIYSLHDGKLRDLEVTRKRPRPQSACYP